MMGDYRYDMLQADPVAHSVGTNSAKSALSKFSF